MDFSLLESKNRVCCLLAEEIADTAASELINNGYTNIEIVKTALEGVNLAEKLEGVHILGVRSRSLVTREILSAAKQLCAIGCFSVGTNQVDVEAAANLGIPVFNAPFASTRSVAELTIAEIVMLLRGVAQKSASAHEGKWLKTAIGSYEVRGKKLGIVGYGHIGAQVSNMAEAMGLKVIYYDLAPVDKVW